MCVYGVGQLSLSQTGNTTVAIAVKCSIKHVRQRRCLCRTMVSLRRFESVMDAIARSPRRASAHPRRRSLGRHHRRRSIRASIALLDRIWKMPNCNERSNYHCRSQAALARDTSHHRTSGRHQSLHLWKGTRILEIAHGWRKRRIPNYGPPLKLACRKRVPRELVPLSKPQESKSPAIRMSLVCLITTWIPWNQTRFSPSTRLSSRWSHRVVEICHSSRRSRRCTTRLTICGQRWLSASTILRENMVGV